MSNVSLPRPQADIDPLKKGGRLQSGANHGDPDVQRFGSFISVPHHIAVAPNFRITEDGDFRITEDGFFRILETA